VDSLQISENNNQLRRIGVICEGKTDYPVIQNILIGYLGEDNFDLMKLPEIQDETDKRKDQGGWESVLIYCASPQFVESLDNYDFLVIQIDTDRIFNHQNFSAINTGLPYLELYTEILRSFERIIGMSIFSKYRSKIIFAISIDTIECWLVPVWCSDRKEKTRNCLYQLTECLKKGNSKINPNSQNYSDYNKLSNAYSKKKDLFVSYKLNPSLASFINELNAKFPLTA
jgi:hypothetical protein